MQYSVVLFVFRVMRRLIRIVAVMQTSVCKFRENVLLLILSTDIYENNCFAYRDVLLPYLCLSCRVIVSHVSSSCCNVG